MLVTPICMAGKSHVFVLHRSERENIIRIVEFGSQEDCQRAIRELS